MNNLSIEDIHEIRELHYEKTKKMNFADYRKSLKQEIASILEMMKKMKKEKVVLDTTCRIAEDASEYQSTKK